MATATTTVTTIMGLVQEDLQELFAASGTTSVLIDYTNRIQQTILGDRPRGWDWTLSTPQKFITELGRTDYWIGSASGQAAGQVDTGLGLSNVRRVRQGHVLLRSGYKELFPTAEAPMVSGWQLQDGTFRSGIPRVFRNDEASPNVLSLYPAPDQGNTYEVVPVPPIVTTAAGGALSARTYFIRISFVDEAGNEGAASTPTTRQFIEANKLITVKAPVAPIAAGTSGIRYNRYNVYASTTEGSETLQNVSPTSTSSDWTEAVGGLTTTGAAVPTTSAIEPLRGYIVEFRYYKAHETLDAGADVLLIPDEYRDVVVAGVNWLGLTYLRQMDMAATWRDIFNEGRVRIGRDQNIRLEFMEPDPMSQTYRQTDGWS